MWKKNVKRFFAAVMAATIIVQQTNVSLAMEENAGFVSAENDANSKSDASKAESEDSEKDAAHGESADEEAKGGESVSDEASNESTDKKSDETVDNDANGTNSGNESSDNGSSLDEDAAETGDPSDEAESDNSDDESDGDDTESSDESEGKETSAGDDDLVADDAKSELPEGVNGMPEGTELSDLQEDLKKSASKDSSFDQFEGLTEGEDYVKNQVITLADSREEAEAVAYAYAGELESYSYGVAVINLKDSEVTVSDAYSYGLNDDYDLPYVEPNYITNEEPSGLVDSVNDSQLFNASGSVASGNGFVERWYTDKLQDPFLNPLNANYQWHHDMINTYSAWGVTTGSKNVTVAVIDTGVNTAHEDLKAASNGATTTATLIASGAEAGDTQGHGTHVAGIIAGRLNNQMGAGIAPGVNILALKISKGNTISTDSILAAINYAAGCEVVNDKVVYKGRRADIANLSLGESISGTLYQTAVDHAYKAGVTLVVAMGNDNGSNHISYPAACNHVIAVCSVDQSGSLSSFSTTGSWADISAPGTHIYSASNTNNSGYVYKNGTSMAAPVVTGACALYMSAVGHVDPDTMEKVIKSAVSGNAGSGSGKGILDLAKIFGGDTAAPYIALKASDSKTLIGEAVSGSSSTVSYDVAKDSKLTFTPLNFGGSTEGNAKTKIVYTSDGTAPSVFNGEVLNGTAISPSSAVSVNTLTGTITEKTRVTVKAAAVTGMGVMGKITTLTFTVNPTLTGTGSSAGNLEIKITNAPKEIVAGKSIKLEAQVTAGGKSEGISQKVTWKISSYKGTDLSKCKINASNGTLSTVAGKTGELVVSCSAAGSSKSATATIKVSSVSPVKTLSVATANPALGFNYSSTPATGQTTVVYVSAMTDNAGHNLLTDNAFSNKTLQWISSNPNVVTVTGTATKALSLKDKTGKAVSANVPAVNIKAVGAGTASITCKVLDGSGKSAKINIKVTADPAKKVTAIALFEGSTATAAKSVFSGAGSFSITAKQTCADKGSNYLNPVWSTSNSKVASIVANGNKVTITPVAKGTANITCAATDGSGKKAVLKVTVLQAVTNITVSGQKYIAAGTSAKFAATVLPATANNKKITWSFADDATAKKLAAEGITINAANGTVSVAKGCAHSGKITVKATATDGKGCSGTYTFEVREKTTKVTAAVDTKGTAKGYNNANINYSNTLSTTVKGSYLNTTRIVASSLNAEGKDNKSELVFKSSNEKIAKVQAAGNNTAIVTAVGNGTANITATAQDGSGKSASVKITVVQLVEKVVVTGQPVVPVGNKASFKAEVYPATSSNKKLKWDVYYINVNIKKQISSVTVNSNGVVTVAPDAPIGKYEITATPLDTGIVPTSYVATSFTTVKNKANHVSIRSVSSMRKDSVNIPVEKGDPLTLAKIMSSCRLYDTNIEDPDGFNETETFLQATASNSSKANIEREVCQTFQWSSSNPKVATVEERTLRYDHGSMKVAVVKGVKPGTANITCTVPDGSGTKATLKVTVITPASGIEVVGANNLTEGPGSPSYDYLVGEGVTTNVKGALGSAYGKPTVSAVEWSYELGFIQLKDKNYSFISMNNKYSNTAASSLPEFCHKNKYFFTMSGSKLKVQSTAAINKALANIYKNYGSNFDLNVVPAVRVTAKTTDGTGYSSSKVFMTSNPTKWIKASYPDKDGSGYSYYSAYRIPSYFITNSACASIRLETNLDSFSSVPQQAFSVTSSNPKVATGVAEYFNAFKDGDKNVVTVYPHAKGTTKLTITALDGTNKKITITIQVN
ncbi:MAG: hypothetical protein E7307_04245 [Butyrivibrio sp.]|nr:hypothetical protein [Butyrivibrio sp.]